MLEVEGRGYRWHELGIVPAGPGVYAWYLLPRISKADLADPASTQEALRQIADRLQFPRMSVQLSGHHSLKLQGSILHSHLGRSKKLPKKIQRATEQEPLRHLLAEILQSCVPNFCSPLYVGVSEDVKRRLLEHKGLIDSLSSFGEQTLMDKDSRGYSFAKEISDRKIDPNDLYVCIHQLTHDLEGKGEDIKIAYEALEGFLHRLFYPTLGRR